MTELSAIQSLDPLRAEIAAKVAAWEAENGPVQTTPIRIGDAPVEQFAIHNPDKPRAEKPSRALRKADHNRVTMRTQKKMAKVSSIRELAATGMKIADMAERLGMTVKYIQRILLEHGIVRGIPAGRVA